MSWPPYLPPLVAWVEFGRPFVPWREFVARLPELPFSDDNERIAFRAQVHLLDDYVENLAHNSSPESDGERSAICDAVAAQRRKLELALLNNEIARAAIIDREAAAPLLDASPEINQRLLDFREREQQNPGSTELEVMAHFADHGVGKNAVVAGISALRIASPLCATAIEVERLLAELRPLREQLLDAHVALAALHAMPYAVRDRSGLSFRRLVEAGVSGVGLFADALRLVRYQPDPVAMGWWIRNRIIRQMLDCWGISLQDLDAIGKVRKARAALPAEDQNNWERIAAATDFSPERCAELAAMQPKRTDMPVEPVGFSVLFRQAE